MPVLEIFLLALGLVATVPAVSYALDRRRSRTAALALAEAESAEAKQSDAVRRAAADQEVAELRRQAVAQAEQQQRDREATASEPIRADPTGAVVALGLAFQNYVLRPLTQVKAIQAGRVAEREAGSVESARELAEATSQIPGWLVAGGIGQVMTTCCVATLPFVVLTAAVLDYRIFLPTFDSSGVALALTPIVIIGIAISSVLLGIGFGWHHSLTANASRYVRQTLGAAGLVGAIAVISWMTSVAPNRTSQEEDRKVAAARSAYNIQLEKTTQQTSGVSRQVLATLKGQLDAAERKRSVAAQHDQISVAIVASVEVPLVEGSLLAAQLLPLKRARRRADGADAEVSAAKEELESANRSVKAATDRFSTDIVDFLTENGVPEPLMHLRQGFATVLQHTSVMEALSTQSLPSPSAPQADQPVPAPAPGPAFVDVPTPRRQSAQAIHLPPREGPATGDPTPPAPSHPIPSLDDLDQAR